MKLSYHVIALAGGLSCWMMSSCNPEDPSAQQEIRKALAETLTKNNRLEAEIAELKAAPPKDDSAQKTALEHEVARLKTELAAANAKVSQTAAALKAQEAKNKELTVVKAKPEVPRPTTPAFAPPVVKKVGEKAPIIVGNQNSPKQPARPQTPPARPARPAPPAPAKPRSNYDIPLQNPIMEPSNR